MQRNAVGVLCKASSFWDGCIHKSRLDPVDPSSGPCLESWRYMDGGMMVGWPKRFEPYIWEWIIWCLASSQHFSPQCCAAPRRMSMHCQSTLRDASGSCRGSKIPAEWLSILVCMKQGQLVDWWMLVLQVVRSSLRREKGREVVMFWYLESITVPEKARGLFGK